LGIGDWGLGIGDWANPQSPIPNPQSPFNFFAKFNNNKNIMVKEKNFIKKIL
jgi:hypothetical protein